MHSLEEARGWIEARVDDVYGARVGKVMDVYFDPEDREVHWLLVRVGLVDGPLALVPVQYSIASPAHVWVPITKDLIKRSPAPVPGHSLSREQELELCFHYGGLRKRTAELHSRAEGTPTAAPSGLVAPFPPR